MKSPHKHEKQQQRKTNKDATKANPRLQGVRGDSKKKKMKLKSGEKSAGSSAPPKPTLSPRPTAAAAAPKASKPKSGGVLQKMRQKLQGGQFRWLNEQLYTTGGGEALELMGHNPALFEQYHEGFREQIKGWPLKPVDVAISWLASRPPSWRVADLGCGDATLAASVAQTVHSFDLIATAPGVVACNMAALPLETHTVDAAVFCLSLMGTDYGAFIEEASRVLTQTGWLWVAEVQSRFMDEGGKSVLEEFVAAVGKLGFDLKRRDVSNSHFLLLEFQGRKGRGTKGGARKVVEWPALRACQYKKR